MVPRIVRIGLVGGGVLTLYAVWETRSLMKEYPWHAGYPLHASTSFPTGTGPPGYVAATVKSPPRIARTEPLDTFVASFYDTAALRFEAVVARMIGLRASPPSHLIPTGAEYASGMFRAVYRDPQEKTLMVSWNAPGYKVEKPTPGGVQMFTAAPNDRDELMITFGMAEWEPPYGPHIDSRVLIAAQRLYSRYLIDGSKRILEKWAKEGK